MWPSHSICFNEDLIYSSKMFNVRAHMQAMLPKPKKPKLARSNSDDLLWKKMAAAKKCMAHMIVSLKPERGKGHI